MLCLFVSLLTPHDTISSIIPPRHLRPSPRFISAMSHCADRADSGGSRCNLPNLTWQGWSCGSDGERSFLGVRRSVLEFRFGHGLESAMRGGGRRLAALSPTLGRVGRPRLSPLGRPRAPLRNGSSDTFQASAKRRNVLAGWLAVHLEGWVGWWGWLARRLAGMRQRRFPLGMRPSPSRRPGTTRLMRSRARRASSA